ncbi:hypothetical protein [Burkholderia ubonensis]|uniref:hypothetical protein n=1 Tax=Burkholderia ubonensis TaxID=101571 RepID=UPI00076DC116|nr:hypothetical protein [Burkholderia ubonensis]KVZ49700.1 hypothetical protein WL16_19380 [Burkholderia ubonensis]
MSEISCCRYSTADRACLTVVQRRGAYARFKDLLEREGVLEHWYAFEGDSVEKALRRWCAENGLEILD